MKDPNQQFRERVRHVLESELKSGKVETRADLVGQQVQLDPEKAKAAYVYNLAKKVVRRSRSFKSAHWLIKNPLSASDAQIEAMEKIVFGETK